jgi:hypothetical protein
MSAMVTRDQPIWKRRARPRDRKDANVRQKSLAGPACFLRKALRRTLVDVNEIIEDDRPLAQRATRYSISVRTELLDSQVVVIVAIAASADESHNQQHRCNEDAEGRRGRSSARIN